MLGARVLWWSCGCWSKRICGTDSSLTSSWTLFRVSSLRFDICNAILFSDAFPKEAVTPLCYPRSGFAVTLVASHPVDDFTDLVANSTFGATILSIAVKIAFWFLSATVSTILLNSLSFLQSKNLSKIFTFTVFSLAVELSPKGPTAKSRSLVPSLTISFFCLSLAV